MIAWIQISEKSKREKPRPYRSESLGRAIRAKYPLIMTEIATWIATIMCPNIVSACACSARLQY